MQFAQGFCTHVIRGLRIQKQIPRLYPFNQVVIQRPESLPRSVTLEAVANAFGFRSVTMSHFILTIVSFSEFHDWAIFAGIRNVSLKRE